MSVLIQYHSASLSPILRESDDFAQLQAYSLESVLRRWAALDTKQGPLTPAEFKTSWIGLQSGSGSGGGSGCGSGNASSTAPDVPHTTKQPRPSAKEFHIKDNGQHIAFQQNLASWPDHQDLLREEAKFVEVVYQVDGQCHFCDQFGHREDPMRPMTNFPLSRLFVSDFPTFRLFQTRSDEVRRGPWPCRATFGAVDRDYKCHLHEAKSALTLRLSQFPTFRHLLFNCPTSPFRLSDFISDFSTF
jgi:hypothetical protein